MFSNDRTLSNSNDINYFRVLLKFIINWFINIGLKVDIKFVTLNLDIKVVGG